MSATAEPDWRALARSPEFQALITSRRRFLVAGTAFYCAYFLAYLCLVGFAPATMSRDLFGSVSFALAGGMSLVVLAVVMAFLHARRAGAWDAMAARVAARAADEPRFTKDATREETVR